MERKVRWKLVNAVCALVEHHEQVCTNPVDWDMYTQEQIARFELTMREITCLDRMLRSTRPEH